MSEQEPQSNQAKDQKKYLVPVMGNRIVWAVLNERKQQIHVIKQRGARGMSIRRIEARYSNPDGAADESGRVIVESSMVADFHLTESGQEELRQRYEQTLAENQARKETYGQ